MTEPIPNLNLSNTMSIASKPHLILDFDSTLAIKRTNPPVHYPQIPELVKTLHETHHLYVASFNPHAERVIENWGLRQYFTDIRCGANFKWTGAYKEKHRINLAKSSQILDMIPTAIEEEIILYDDSKEKLTEVLLILPKVKTILVNPKTGFTGLS